MMLYGLFYHLLSSSLEVILLKLSSCFCSLSRQLVLSMCILSSFAFLISVLYYYAKVNRTALAKDLKKRCRYREAYFI